ncbi:MAG TPA: acylneuraminate cytidylyltransferase family protein [Gemmatimonadaceae bacterium]|nr:acylneuraminate cytidylyltransferase family protein [Gemmatimonadaceae bacterium]
MTRGAVLGAVCARGGSKGIPRKNLRLLGNRPLIGLAIECARRATTLDKVVVSTDDEEMAAVARSFGAEVPFLRPSELAQDHTSKWDVFRHLVESYEQISGERVSTLVDLDTGVPLRSPGDIDGCVRLLEKSDGDVVVTAYASERNPYFNMVERGSDGYMKVVKVQDPPIVARQLAPQVYSLSPSVYAIKRDALWRYDHWSQSRLQVYEVPRERAIDIDTDTDFALVECLMTRSSSK